MKRCDIGIIGLAVMGQNLARNAESKGYRVAVYNRTNEKTQNFVATYEGEFYGAETLQEFVESLARPRKIIMMVKAGPAVDAVLFEISQYLEPGDIVIDGGNSLYRDTERREKEMKERSIMFFGCGVSGGEKGALHGPSMMPGGDKEAWKQLQPVLEAMAAKDFSGGPCVTHIGSGGAGHYVKMVHNGIEYAVMQMMAEAYEILQKLGGMSAGEIGDVFEKYNTGELKSFLFEIVAPVLRKKDAETGKYIIDVIADEAGQKGTGRWTAIDALERGVIATVIEMAVEARMISSKRALRKAFAKQYKQQKPEIQNSAELIGYVEKALISGVLVAYSEGLELIKTASKEEGWDINIAEVVRIWQGGCIIRARMLKMLEAVLRKEPQTHMLLRDDVREKMHAALPGLRWVVARGAEHGVPLLALGAALGTLDGLKNARGSANLIQGLRDSFGAHTYKRTDKEGVFHTHWNDK